MMKTSVLLKDILDFFYPRICPACALPLQEKEKMLCIYCRFKLPKTGFHLETDNPVEKIFKGRILLLQADAWLYFRKKGITQRLMHEIKYKGNASLGKHLGALYGKELKESYRLIKPDIICSVPMHPDKLKVRAYNHSEIIASGLAESWEIPFDPSLILRKKNTKSQTRMKRYQRWENISESFQINPVKSGLYKHIAIVDDVLTTGSTLEACSNALKKSQGTEISVFSLCLAIN